jgi:hypothetical protein
MSTTKHASTHIEANAELFQWDRDKVVNVNPSCTQSGLGVSGNKTSDQIWSDGEF